MPGPPARWRRRRLAGNNGAMIAASAEIYVSALKVIANGR
jgi:hypothetical protein